MFDTSSSSVKSVLPPRSLSAYAMNNSFIAFSLLGKIVNKCNNIINVETTIKLTTKIIKKSFEQVNSKSSDRATCKCHTSW